jgi:glycine dehydrogenase subunit 2
MIEPTETESKEDIDLFIEAMKSIAVEAKEDPELLRASPAKCRRRRLDETTAARKPCLSG